MDLLKFWTDTIAGCWPFAALIVASLVIVPLSLFW